MAGIILAGLLGTGMGSAPADEDVEPVAVLFTGIRASPDHEEVAAALETRVAARISEDGRVGLVTNWELGRIVDVHADLIIAGCEDDCPESLDILRALDAPLLLVGQLHAVGGRFDLSLTLLETSGGRVRGRAVGEADGERQLMQVAEALSFSVLRQADLVRAGLDGSGMPVPRFHLAFKAGNSLARVGAELVRGNLHGGRLNIEGNYYLTENVLLFLEVGATFGRGRADDDGVFSLGMVPAGLGVKRLWLFDRTRLWAGGALGAGFFGLFFGQTTDVIAAFSTTLVIGADWRLSRRWTLQIEAATSLTDALLGRARDRDFGVPLLAGITVGAGWLIP